MGDSHISAFQVELSDGNVKDCLWGDQTQDTVSSSEAIARIQSVTDEGMNKCRGGEDGGRFRKHLGGCCLLNDSLTKVHSISLEKFFFFFFFFKKTV